MGARPAVDVVVITWNDGELLEAALASVDATLGVDAHVIVVDNGSEPPATLGGRAGHLERNQGNAGVAPARNQGVRLGSAAYVLLLDSDAALTPDALAQLVDALEADPGAALAAPVFVDQAPTASAGAAPTLRTKLERLVNLRDTYEGASAGASPEAAVQVDFAIGACQLFRRAAFDEVGGLDETYFYGPEDVDFCLRLRTAGWRVLQVPTAVVHHPPRRRNRRILSKRGVAHARAVVRHLWRHRAFAAAVSGAPWRGGPPVEAPPAIDVSIVAYGSKDLLPRCLAALDGLPGLASCTIVDHGTDGSGEAARGTSLGSVPVDVLVDPTNPGFGAGHNHAVARGRSPWLLLLNPDARVEAAAVAAGVAAVDGDARVAAVQGVVVGPAGPERSAGRPLGPIHLVGRLVGARRLLRLAPVRAVAGRTLLRDHVVRVADRPRRVGSLAATAVAVRRSAYEEVGGFDERYFLYGEDLDLSARLRAAGHELVTLDEVWADHISGASAGDTWTRELLWWGGTLEYAARWWGAAGWAVARLAGALRALTLVAARPARRGEVVARLLRTPQRARRQARSTS